MLDFSDWIRPQFNSVGFLLAFSILFIVYQLLGKRAKDRHLILLLFSLFFYYLLSGPFVVLLAGMAFLDYSIGKKMLQTSEDRRFIWRNLSLVMNIGVLGGFKYFWFFTDALGIPWYKPEFWMVPVGISFFVFKSLSYILDIMNESIEEAETDYKNYLLYVSFFPTILAGPIVLARDFLPQLKESHISTKQENGEALFLILIGMIKKYAFADYLVLNLVDRVFDNPHLFTGMEHMIAAYGYTFQLYLDFSGYSEMMIGGALLFGFRIQQNFNQPFMAGNISDFWRRWHISLSRWFQEFVFIPLNFAWRAHGKNAAIAAVIVTFLLSGLWHGAAWTFILWGLLHGLAIAWDFFSVQWRQGLREKVPGKFWNVGSILLSLNFIVFSVILFRSDSLEMAMEMYNGIFTRFKGELFPYWIETYSKPFYLLLIVIFLHYLPNRITTVFQERFSRLSWYTQSLILIGAILFVFQFVSEGQVAFQYLEF
jgi:D-alanyl-lipoteichoic acid acyltransferase DltB (MBOAT superfamily)